MFQLFVRLKKRLYFVLAAYFALWARIVLWRWRPRIIVITGSTGKTTLLHLVEAQLDDKAIYTHHANSSFGVPFHILGLHPNIDSRYMWPLYVLRAPFQIFRSLPHTKLFVVECDADRPNEGKFLSKLLKPEVVLWISVYRTHSMNYDRLVPKKFISHERAIAHEYGHFAAAASRLVVINADQPELKEEAEKVTTVDLREASVDKITNYELTQTGTLFELGSEKISLPGLHPKEVAVSLQLVDELMDYLKLPLDKSYQKIEMPPGRASVFKGKQNTTLIDSTYNTGLGAIKAILKLFADFPSQHKWLVIGDILEQGSLEKVEHLKLADKISEMKVDKVVLVGPRTSKYAMPILQKVYGENVVSFDGPTETLEYLKANLKGGEALLFKGSRFLEGVVEQLLADPSQESQLVRRGKLWTKRRQHWGLPK